MAEIRVEETAYGPDVISDPVDHDWSWLILPLLVFLLWIPAMLPTPGAPSHGGGGGAGSQTAPSSGTPK